MAVASVAGSPVACQAAVPRPCPCVCAAAGPWPADPGAWSSVSVAGSYLSLLLKVTHTLFVTVSTHPRARYPRGHEACRNLSYYRRRKMDQTQRPAAPHNGDSDGTIRHRLA